jgi:hypothetical protein
VWYCQSVSLKTFLICLISEPYTIVYPQIIDNKAGIMVNNVKNYVRRRKRTLGGENKPLEISISGGKEMFDLELWENDKLLAPGFKIYRRTTLKNSQSDKEVRQEDVYGCHFTGHVKAKSNNPASLSICNGLVSCKILCIKKSTHEPFYNNLRHFEKNWKKSFFTNIKDLV